MNMKNEQAHKFFAWLLFLFAMRAGLFLGVNATLAFVIRQKKENKEENISKSKEK